MTKVIVARTACDLVDREDGMTERFSIGQVKIIDKTLLHDGLAVYGD